MTRYQYIKFYSRRLEQYFLPEKVTNIEDFYDDMYCPECHQAKLTYVRGTKNTKPYLRTHKGEQHKHNCKYNYDICSHTTANEYFKILTQKQLSNKMDSIWCKFFSKYKINKFNSSSKNKDKMDLENPLVIKNDRKLKKGKILCECNLSNLNKNMDLDCGHAYAFYGKIKLKLVANSMILKIYREGRNIIDAFLGYQLEQFIKEDDEYKILIIGILDYYENKEKEEKILQIRPFKNAVRIEII